MCLFSFLEFFSHARGSPGRGAGPSNHFWYHMILRVERNPPRREGDGLVFWVWYLRGKRTGWLGLGKTGWSCNLLLLSLCVLSRPGFVPQGSYSRIPSPSIFRNFPTLNLTVTASCLTKLRRRWFQNPFSPAFSLLYLRCRCGFSCFIVPIYLFCFDFKYTPNESDLVELDFSIRRSAPLCSCARMMGPCLVSKIKS